MAKELKQSVTQYNIDEFVPKRVIVQFIENEQENQVIVDYNSLTEDEKIIFDNYQILCETLMNS
jgi:hypothetical protein